MEKAQKIRVAALGAALLAMAPFGLRATGYFDGCDAFIPSAMPLIAHAGGGLPDATYTNSREALDLSARHGFSLIEIDFIMEEGVLRIGHDSRRMSELTIAQLNSWLDAHPGVLIVTDVKTDNVEGLAALKGAVGPRINRFVPQIYAPSEYQPVVAMGYPAPILTIYRIGDSGWQEAANRLPLRAVTMPLDRRELAKGLNKPVYLHTVNEPMEGFGLYTDCLIPARKAA